MNITNNQGLYNVYKKFKNKSVKIEGVRHFVFNEKNGMIVIEKNPYNRKDNQITLYESNGQSFTFHIDFNYTTVIGTSNSITITCNLETITITIN